MQTMSTGRYIINNTATGKKYVGQTVREAKAALTRDQHLKNKLERFAGVTFSEQDDLTTYIKRGVNKEGEFKRFHITIDIHPGKFLRRKR